MAMKVVKAGSTFQAGFKVGNSLFGNNILRKFGHTLGTYQKNTLNYVGVYKGNPETNLYFAVSRICSRVLLEFS